jgi:hypothetical protein
MSLSYNSFIYHQYYINLATDSGIEILKKIHKLRAKVS